MIFLNVDYPWDTFSKSVLWISFYGEVFKTSTLDIQLNPIRVKDSSNSVQTMLVPIRISQLLHNVRDMVYVVRFKSRRFVSLIIFQYFEPGYVTRTLLFISPISK